MDITFVSLVAEPLHSAYRELCRELEGSGLPISWLEPTDWTQAGKLLENGTAQAGAMCGLLYTLFRARGVPLVPVAGPVFDTQDQQLFQQMAQDLLDCAGMRPHQIGPRVSQPCRLHQLQFSRI